LAAIAEFERDLIRERMARAGSAPWRRGVKFGRKPKLSEYQRQEALKRRAAGETLAEIAKSYAVDAVPPAAIACPGSSMEVVRIDFANQPSAQSPPKCRSVAETRPQGAQTSRFVQMFQSALARLEGWASSGRGDVRGAGSRRRVFLVVLVKSRPIIGSLKLPAHRC
jgi:hypothetical protein